MSGLFCYHSILFSILTDTITVKCVVQSHYPFDRLSEHHRVVGLVLRKNVILINQLIVLLESPCKTNHWLHEEKMAVSTRV